MKTVSYLKNIYQMLKLLSYITRKKSPFPEYKKRKGLPKSWNDVSINEFLQLDKIQSTGARDKNVYRMYADTVALFTGQDREDVRAKYKVKHLNRYMAKMPFLNDKVQTWFPPKFKIDGVEYECHGNINEGHGWQSIMISNYMQQGVEKHLHYICACLIWEPTETKPGDTVEKRAQYFLNHLPISVANGLAAFFLSNSIGLLNATQHYLERKMKTESRRNRTGFLNVGAGWQRLKRYLRIT